MIMANVFLGLFFVAVSRYFRPCYWPPLDIHCRPIDRLNVCSFGLLFFSLQIQTVSKTFAVIFTSGFCRSNHKLGGLLKTDVSYDAMSVLSRLFSLHIPDLPRFHGALSLGLLFSWGAWDPIHPKWRRFATKVAFDEYIHTMYNKEAFILAGIFVHWL